MATDTGPARGAAAAVRAANAANADGATTAGAANGERIYREACLPCHGATGTGGEGGGASLLTGLTADTVLAVTGAGRNNMPAFGEVYSAAELRDVATYITEVLTRGQ